MNSMLDTPSSCVVVSADWGFDYNMMLLRRDQYEGFLDNPLGPTGEAQSDPEAEDIFGGCKAYHQDT